MNVGIGSVAKLAGVSVTTVSNLLNGRAGRMSIETRQRVMQAIESLGYSPNTSARQLKTGKSETLGLIVPSVANPFWGLAAHEIEKAAMAHGYNVVFCNADRDPELERRYAEKLMSYGVRGLILGSSPLSFAHFRGLVARGLVIAAFDRSAQDADISIGCSVSVDNRLGARLAVQHLIGLGHRRIGAISGPVRTASRIARIEGYRDAMRAACLPLRPDLVWEGAGISGFGDREGADLGRAGMRELLTRPEPPTAVFVINDLYALGAYAGARDLGRVVPNDLSIVGFDDILLSEIAQPPLTTVRQPIAAMAANLVDALLAKLQGGPGSDVVHLTALPELVVRGSAAPPHQQS